MIATHKSPFDWHASDIAYCSNVHAGECLEDIKRNLSRFIQPVREQRHLQTMATGLWLSAAAATTLQEAKELKNFQLTLHGAGLQLTSINGFPFGNFHQEKIKAKVYLPDWSDPARLLYTKNLADILAVCLPEHCKTGAISTLPLGYKHYWNKSKHNIAITHLEMLTLHLNKIKQTTGKHILICLEMEPDCVLESCDEFIHVFQHNIQARIAHSEHLAACYNVCHQSVMHEDAYTSLSRLTRAGINIGKIQLSSALHVDFNNDQDTNNELLKLLEMFSEPTYLHQVKTTNNQGVLVAIADLSLALSKLNNTDSTLTLEHPWRIHFHVPIHCQQLLHPQLQTTNSDLLQVFNFLNDNRQIKPCLEVETYSWQVLPKTLRPNNDKQLIAGIVKELRWVEDQLTAKKLMIK